MSYMGYQGQDQPCEPSPDFPDAAIVAKGGKIIEDISLEEAYATGVISDDLMVSIMGSCRPDECAKLLIQMAEDEDERLRDVAQDAQLDEYMMEQA